MMSGWREVTLKDVADLIMGQSPPGSTYNEHGEGLPFFQGTKDFNYLHPTPHIFCSAPTRIAHAGDILFSVRAPIGRVNIADRECAIGRGLAIVRSHSQSDARYIEFVLRNLESSWTVIEGSGSVFGNATKRDLESLSIRWPCDESERASIAHVLGTLDDKIELNRRMNRTLEEMARSVFKDWFVDFGPTRAKMEGREAYLPSEVWGLFPERLVETEAGEAPEGWGVKALGEVVEIHDSKRIPLNSRQRAERQGPYPYYGAAGVMDHVDDYLFDGIHILVGEDGSVIDDDDNPVVQYVHGQFWVNNHAHVLKGKGPITEEYLYLFLKQVNIRAFVTGAVQPKLNQRNLKSIPFIMPSELACDKFTSAVESIYTKIRMNTRESVSLVALRDALLPRLVSGELKAGARGARI